MMERITKRHAESKQRGRQEDKSERQTNYRHKQRDKSHIRHFTDNSQLPSHSPSSVAFKVTASCLSVAFREQLSASSIKHPTICVKALLIDKFITHLGICLVSLLVSPSKVYVKYVAIVMPVVDILSRLS